MTNAEYVTQMEAQLKKWDADVDELRMQGKNLAANARAAYFANIKGLSASREAARRTFHDMRAASEAAGAEMKAGMEGAWETMRKALEGVSPTPPQ